MKRIKEKSLNLIDVEKIPFFSMIDFCKIILVDILVNMFLITRYFMSSTYLLISNSATYTVINNGMFDFLFVYLSLKIVNILMKIETIPHNGLFWFNQEQIMSRNLEDNLER